MLFENCDKAEYNIPKKTKKKLVETTHCNI